MAAGSRDQEGESASRTDPWGSVHRLSFSLLGILALHAGPALSWTRASPGKMPTPPGSGHGWSKRHKHLPLNLPRDGCRSNHTFPKTQTMFREPGPCFLEPGEQKPC